MGILRPRSSVHVCARPHSNPAQVCNLIWSKNVNEIVSTVRHGGGEHEGHSDVLRVACGQDIVNLVGLWLHLRVAHWLFPGS